MGIKLSACTIAKNEAINIGKSIDSYKDYVDEIIIVDTGSIDETIEIAKEKGAKVLNFEWNNDFAAAKNFALDNATGDWIIFLDADEWFDKDTAKNLKAAIESTIKQGYDAAACKLVNFYTETEVMETASTIRIFRHAKNIRFNRPIHEALFDFDKNIPLPGLFSELLIINHSGYMKDILEKKAKRNKILLDKNFASGKASYIDYFYGMRENSKEDINVADFFYKLIENTENYDELISSFNVSTSVDETKVKVTNFFPNKYSFEYRVKLLEDIQKKHVNNPTFKFFEYMLFEKVDKKRAIKALQDAVEFEKNFEQENAAASNPFYSNKSVAYSKLGEYFIFTNDKMKALECFSQAVKADNKNLEALFGLLYVVGNEKNEEIIMFLNSLYDVSNKEIGNFLVDALRITKFKDVFLYYFVDYYKKHGEVDQAFFTSRLITGDFEEVIDRYVKVYKESKDERALLLISAALIVNNSKDKFIELIEIFSGVYSKILYAYFDDQKIDKSNEKELQVVLGIFKELSYIANDEIIEKIVNIVEHTKGRFIFEMLRYYYSHYSYDYILKWINKLNKKIKDEKELNSYISYLLTNIYFRYNEFEKIPEVLEKTIAGGLLSQDIVLICEMLEADDEKLKEYYELFDNLNFAKINMLLDDIKDKANDSIKFMTIEKLEEELKYKLDSVTSENLSVFYSFAEKAKQNKAFVISERYYKIALKYGFKVDKCYLALGEIYNKFGKAELSFYCYEKAFVENFTLASNLLPNNHANKNYVFFKKEEKNILNCPICGSESKEVGTYINIFDEKLTYNDPMIVKYRCCNECEHIFAENDVADKIYWENEPKTKASDDKILLSYDILENICEITDGTTILDYSNDNGEFESAAVNYGFSVEKNDFGKTFEIILSGESLNGIYEVESALRKQVENLNQEGIIVFKFYDEGNAFSKLADRPLWAKSGVKNIFSKKSISILFEKVGLQILQINIDKINKGQIIVFASK